MKKWRTLIKAIGANGPCALATVVATKGSTPRETDAWMIVTANGFHGSIGGGTVEWRVMAKAQDMLGKGKRKTSLDYVLGPDLGQCCGGRMQVEIETFTSIDVPLLGSLAENGQDTAAPIYIFGAGHVGRALVLALAPFPNNVTWVDPRPNAFPSTVPQNVSLLQLQEPTTVLQRAPVGSLIYIMSHSHALDFEIVDTALRYERLVVGVIGSDTKRARFEKRLAEAGHSHQRIAQLMCPIGIAGIQSKHPAAIAASVVAQVLQFESVQLHAVNQRLQHDLLA